MAALTKLYFLLGAALRGSVIRAFHTRTPRPYGYIVDVLVINFELMLDIIEDSFWALGIFLTFLVIRLNYAK